MIGQNHHLYDKDFDVFEYITSTFGVVVEHATSNRRCFIAAFGFFVQRLDTILVRALLLGARTWLPLSFQALADIINGKFRTVGAD